MPSDPADRPSPTDAASPASATALASQGPIRRTFRLARLWFASDERATAWALLGALTVFRLAQVGVQLRLNLWHRDAFDALQRQDQAAFLTEAWIFPLIALAAMATAVAQLWAAQMLALRWRTWLVGHLQARWMDRACHWRMAQRGDAGADNPDQRIAVNTHWATAMAIDLAGGLLHAVLMLATFLGVLWTLSGPLPLGHGIALPGWLVFAALLYAALGLVVTLGVGLPMVGLQIRRNAAEADHRFALVRLREHGEAVALARGGPDETRRLAAAFAPVVAVTRQLLRRDRQLMWLGSGYGLVAGVLPLLLLSPRHFAGTMTLGALMQAAGAFVEVARALAWFQEAWPRLADWRGHAERVVALEDALDAAAGLPAGSASPPAPMVPGPCATAAARAPRRGASAEGGGASASARPVASPTGGPAAGGGGAGLRIRASDCAPATEEVLAFHDLRLDRPDGRTLIAGATATIRRGERVLIRGESGLGKSTLLRAAAGLWPWGKGCIVTPPEAATMVLPQRPYLPLGTLAAALAYPAALAGTPIPEAELAAALARCGLPHLAPRLGEEAPWDRLLSLGEQQRLGFARLLLRRPRWALLDEATSALDPAAEARVMGLFAAELAGTTLVSIGHRPGLEAWHDRVLVLTPGEAGGPARLRDAPLSPPPAPPMPGSHAWTVPGGALPLAPAGGVHGPRPAPATPDGWWRVRELALTPPCR